MIKLYQLIKVRNAAFMIWTGCVIWNDVAHSQAAFFIDVAKTAGINHINTSGSAEKQYIIETQPAGGGFWDYNNDGILDIYLTNGVPGDSSLAKTVGTALYRGQVDAHFTDITDSSNTHLTGWTMGVTFADYDGDGDADLYATRWGPDVLLRNNGDGTFSNHTEAAGLGSSRWGIGASFADFDLDGDLDLYVANYIDFALSGPPFYDQWCTHNGIQSACGPVGATPQADLLYRNEGNGHFAEVSAEVGLTGPSYYAMGVLWTDYDDDGDPDLYVANDGHPNTLFRNDRKRFVDVALVESVAYSGDGRPQAGMGVAAGDYDRDGLFDLFVTNFSQDHNTLYRNSGKGYFSDVSGQANLAGTSRPHMGWGTFFFDLDSDGYEDLFVANGHLMPEIEQAGIAMQYRQPNLLYHNDGQGRFKDISNQAGSGLKVREVSRAAAYGDYDNDGDLDILVVNLDAAPNLLRNDSQQNGNWLSVSLRSGGSNREGIGARIYLQTEDGRQMREVRTGTSFQSQNDLRQHFGLAENQHADIIVRWADATEQHYTSVKANRFYTIFKEDNKITVE